MAAAGTCWRRGRGLASRRDNAPVYERFYAGGFQSMRGFEFRGVGPAINGFEIGGDFLFLNSLEYQIPLRANDQIYVVGFVDSGTVESRVNIDSYRVAAGFGLRIVVPMLGPVPIALDFGFPIVRASEDKDQLFSFWVGFHYVGYPAARLGILAHALSWYSDSRTVID